MRTEEPGGAGEFEHVEALLAAARADEEAVLDAARDTSFPKGEERARQFVEFIDDVEDGVDMGVDVRASQGAGRRLRWWPMAAALVIAAGLTWRARPDREPDMPRGHSPEIMLGGRLLELTSPAESEAEWGSFRLRALVPSTEIPPIRVVVYAGDGPDADPIATSPLLEGLLWTPRPAQCSDWPSTIYWEVVSMDPQELLGSRVSRLR